MLLAICLVAGLIAERLHFPKVTAYLLVGLFFGPSILDWLPHEHIESLTLITKLAMALVLFNLGCHFPLAHIRRVFRRSLCLSMGELGLTFVVVSAGLLLFGQSWEVALLLGALALATAPATTILVLKESTSQGPVTEHTSTLVALNNFASIIAFEIIFISVHLANGKLTSPLHVEFSLVLRDVAGSIGIGLLAGFIVSYGCGLVSQNRWLVLLIAATTVVLGCCEMLALPYMLAFLAMGVMVVNSSDLGDAIVDELDHLTGLLCVIFFAVHGAELDLHAFYVAGLVGILYIVCRCIGKCAGIYIVARVIGEPAQVRTWLGPSLLAQAGAAIALSAIAVSRDPVLGQSIQTVILGSVVFFEIVGPFLIRQSVLRAGEVPLAQAIHHTTAAPLGQLGKIWNRLLLAFGYNAKSPSHELTVGDLMRRNVAGIPESATFDEVIVFIEHSHDNTYPVVSPDNSVVGQICYSRFSSVLFDPTVEQLVRAEDLATSIPTLLHVDDPATLALDLFRDVAEDCIPVVSRDEPCVLTGIVRRSDVTNMLIRGHRQR